MGSNNLRAREEIRRIRRGGNVHAKTRGEKGTRPIQLLVKQFDSFAPRGKKLEETQFERDRDWPQQKSENLLR